jgi:hypothetical protein
MYASKQSGVLATFRTKNVYIFIFALLRLFSLRKIYVHNKMYNTLA